MDISRIGQENVNDAVELSKALDSGAAKKASAEATQSLIAETDSAELSSRGKELKELKEVLENLPEIREKKVAQLKKAIADGSFDPSGLEIVESMSPDLLEELISD